MLKYILTICLLIPSIALFSQGGVGINNSGTAPNTNSMLDVSSNSKGVLITRLTTTERVTLGNGMGLTENGMLVYDKDLLSFHYWDGTQWVLVGNGTGSDDQNLTGATLTGTSLQIDIENGTSTTVDLATLQDGVDDADNDPNNEIELPATATTGQVLSWNGTAWVAQNSASGADNWGNQVVNTTGTNISGDGTTGNPLTITEVDGDITNEIQDLTLNTTTNILTITNKGTASNIDLNPYLDNTDAQTLSLVGNTLTISNGNNVTLTDNVNDGDFDATNEIELPTGGTNGQVLSTDGSGNYTWINDNTGTDNQDLSLTGNTLSLTNDGTTVNLATYLDNTDNQNITGSSFNATTGDLVIGIQNGTSQTLNFNGLKDHDWYEVGGTTAPDNINDNIYTQGNVGIGDINPEARLHVSQSDPVGTETNALILDSETAGANRAMQINWKSNGVGYYSSIVGVDDGGFDGRIDFRTSDDGVLSPTPLTVAETKMTIKQNGNVGIGTNAPQQKLHVDNGITLIQNSDGSNGLLLFDADGNGTAAISDFASIAGLNGGLSLSGLASAITSPQVYITNNGNVGIGTVSPSRLLTNIDAASPFVNVLSGAIGQNAKSLSWYNDAIGFSASIINTSAVNSANGLHVRTENATANAKILTLGTGVSSVANANTDVMTVLGNGNVGIGTTAPSENLHVKNNLKLGLLIDNGTTPQPPGYGSSIIFSGAPDVSPTFDGENSDVISLRRYNVASDQSELRLILGDNAQVGDAFSIGYANFTEMFRFETAGVARKAGGGTWAATSDERTKKDIVNFSDGLNILTKINPVTFKYNGLYNTPNNGTNYVGIIAQEVQKVAPYMIGSYDATKTQDSNLKEEILNYDGGTYMLYILVNSVKEQQKQIEELQRSNKVLIKEIESLKK